MTQSTTLARAACASFSLAAILSLSSQAHAQEATHDGFYFRGGAGPTFLTLRGHNPAGGTASITGLGTSTSFAIGGSIAPGLSFAGTLQGASIDADFKGGPYANATVTADGKIDDASRDAVAKTAMLGLLVDWYPRPSGGFHAGLSTGLGAIALTNMAGRGDYTGVDLAGSIFVGYDWHIAPKWSVGLQLNASSGTKTKLKDGDADTGYELTPLAIGLSASLLHF